MNARESAAEMATKAIVGEKVGMTQVWDDQNRVVPVTVLKVTPARVVQVKRPDTDGYSAVQVTYGTKKARSLTKPESGPKVRPTITYSPPATGKAEDSSA